MDTAFSVAWIDNNTTCTGEGFVHTVQYVEDLNQGRTPRRLGKEENLVTVYGLDLAVMGYHV